MRIEDGWGPQWWPESAEILFPEVFYGRQEVHEYFCTSDNIKLMVGSRSNSSARTWTFRCRPGRLLRLPSFKEKFVVRSLSDYVISSKLLTITIMREKWGWLTKPSHPGPDARSAAATEE